MLGATQTPIWGAHMYAIQAMMAGVKVGKCVIAPKRVGLHVLFEEDGNVVYPMDRTLRIEMKVAPLHLLVRLEV